MGFRYHSQVSMCLCVYVSMCLCVCVSMWLYIFVSVCLCAYVSMCLCVYASMCLCVYVSMCLCVYASVCLCVCVSMCLCVYVSMCLSDDATLLCWPQLYLLAVCLQKERRIRASLFFLSATSWLVQCCFSVVCLVSLCAFMSASLALSLSLSLARSLSLSRARALSLSAYLSVCLSVCLPACLPGLPCACSIPAAACMHLHDNHDILITHTAHSRGEYWCKTNQNTAEIIYNTKPRTEYSI